MWPPATASTVEAVLAFFSLPSQVWDAFCGAVGDPGSDMRVLASMPVQMLAEGVMAARLASGRRLTPVEAIRVGMIFRAAIGWSTFQPVAAWQLGRTQTLGPPRNRALRQGRTPRPRGVKG